MSAQIIGDDGAVIRLEVARSLPARLRGLYGRGSFDGELLLFPCDDIHTLFMRRPIDVAFVSNDGCVIESHRAVGPNCRLRNPDAVAVLERFATETPWHEPGETCFLKGSIA